MAAHATASIEGEVRAGSRLLAIFENPLHARVQRAHVEGPCRLVELQERTATAQTTVRAAVSNLQQLGALRKQAAGESGYAATELTAAGEGVRAAAAEGGAWVAAGPRGPISPEGAGGRGA